MDPTQVYETGNDTTAWYAKVRRVDGRFAVIVYDADGTERVDQAKSFTLLPKATAYADEVVLPWSEKTQPESADNALSVERPRAR